MTSRFSLEICCDNAAFEPGEGVPEVTRILRNLADRMEEQNGLYSPVLQDINGNTVGRANWQGRPDETAS